MHVYHQYHLIGKVAKGQRLKRCTERAYRLDTVYWYDHTIFTLFFLYTNWNLLNKMMFWTNIFLGSRIKKKIIAVDCWFESDRFSPSYSSYKNIIYGKNPSRVSQSQKCYLLYTVVWKCIMCSINHFEMLHKEPCLTPCIQCPFFSSFVCDGEKGPVLLLRLQYLRGHREQHREWGKVR